MGKKDNFNQAMLEMFGVGKEPAETVKQEPEAAIEPVVEPVTEPETVPQEKVPEAIEEQVVVPATYFAPGTSMEGTLRAKGDVEIAGDFKGDIFSDGNVILRSGLEGNVTSVGLDVLNCKLVGDAHVDGHVLIDETSYVQGNLYVGDLLCSGKITGDLNVVGNVTLDEHARVFGKITAGTITVARGAVICGSLEMREV